MRHSKIFAAVILSGAVSAAAAQDANNYGRNIISVSPVHLSEFTMTGVGLQFEHFIGASNKLSVSVPFAYSFGQSNPCDASIRTHMLYTYPGVKFYPAGNQHMVTYAVGPSLAAGTGNTNCDCVNDNVPTTDVTVHREYKPITEVGMLLNNSVNIQAAQHIYMGAEIGIGGSFVNMEDGKNVPGDLMLQMNVKVGYRF